MTREMFCQSSVRFIHHPMRSHFFWCTVAVVNVCLGLDAKTLGWCLSGFDATKLFGKCPDTLRPETGSRQWSLCGQPPPSCPSPDKNKSAYKLDFI